MDTRSTNLFLSAQATVEASEWADDPFLLRPPLQPNPASPAVPMPQPSQQRNVFASVLTPDGLQYSAPSDGTFELADGTGLGFPVYVDPVLANSDAFQIDNDAVTGPPPVYYKRVAIRTDIPDDLGNNYRTMAPFNTGNPPPLYDLVIHTVADAQWMPPDSPQGRREAYLRRWFFSGDDLRFEDANAVIPQNPRRLGTTQPWEYFQYPNLPGDTNGTSLRNGLFSWSFLMLGRPLVVDPTGTFLQPSGAMSDFSQVYVLIFRNRNHADPYALVRGCFFDGSSTVTLSWPNALPAPRIRRGSWLMEYTNTGGLRSSLGPVPPAVTHRQQVTFHRVSGFEDAIIDGNGEWHQVVNLESPMANYPVDWDDPATPTVDETGDLRGLPDQYDPSAAVLTFPYPGNPVPDNVPLWVPVIVWDGLIEVFRGR
jgi:hypothetical protein